MKHWLSLFFLSTALLCVKPAMAQDDTAMRQIYTQAENDYNVGRIESARDLLLGHLSELRGTVRQSSLRLISLCFLARFDTQQAEHFAKMLIENDPYYTPSAQDPPAFADIIADIKAGLVNTVTTASSQAETLPEVPVPTTLITEEMIQNCGGRNLQEVLTAYVPGMYMVDCNDDINLAMHGIYSNSQEKILIMLNGHRLNSYATNIAAPDFSISIDKVKQIEVLRGPASSLYGDVALTAVVNIITKQGVDVDGIRMKAAAGNHGQMTASALFGKRYFDVDMLVWGSVYRNSGEERLAPADRAEETEYGMPAEKITIGRIGNRPSYDMGLQLSWKGLQLLYDSHFSQVVAPFTLSSLALSYDHDRYCTHNGFFPSFATSSQHLDVGYQFNFQKFNLKVSATYDKADFTQYQVVNDLPMPTFGSSISLPIEIADIFADYPGTSKYINGQEQNLGVQAKGNYNYALGSSHKGSLSFGAEFRHFQLDDMRYQIGYNFDCTATEDPLMRNLGTGMENSADVYLQFKHQWKSLILNAGLRYDYKHRFDHSEVNEFSPRVALILLRPKWQVRLSYSKSFVDAPFVYRTSNKILSVLAKETEEEYKSLLPERVHSLQLSFAANNWIKGFSFEINGFYNKAYDLIMTHVIEYDNAGKNQTAGVELMANYKCPRFSADFNLTFTRTFKANILGLERATPFVGNANSAIDDNNNTPVVMSNVVLAWQTTKRLKLHSHVLFEGRQYSYNTDVVKLVEIDELIATAMSTEHGMGGIYVGDKIKVLLEDIIFKKKIPARAIFNVGADYDFGPVSLGLNVHNLFNTRYDRSGMNTNLIPQKGRWWQISITCQL